MAISINVFGFNSKTSPSTLVLLKCFLNHESLCHHMNAFECAKHLRIPMITFFNKAGLFYRPRNSSEMKHGILACVALSYKL